MVSKIEAIVPIPLGCCEGWVKVYSESAYLQLHGVESMSVINILRRSTFSYSIQAQGKSQLFSEASSEPRSLQTGVSSFSSSHPLHFS